MRTGDFVNVKVYARYSARSCSRANFGLAPMIVVCTAPLLNTFIAGMEVIWYFIARSGFSSTLSLRIVILSGCSDWIWSRTGETMRHGPHHSAQKSTSTGPSAWSTSCSNVAEVVALAVICLSPSLGSLSTLIQRERGVKCSRACAAPGRALRGVDLGDRLGAGKSVDLGRVGGGCAGLAECGEEVLDIEGGDRPAARGGDRLT